MLKMNTKYDKRVQEQQKEQIEKETGRRFQRLSSGIRTIDDVCIEPCTRNFIVASVGSGKSTLASHILERYYKKYPHHRIYIIDYKERFFPKQIDKNEPGYGWLFPFGCGAWEQGRKQGVTINARLGNHPIRWSLPRGGAVVIQGEDQIKAFYPWAFQHHDIKQPMVVFLDESFDTMSGNRADPNLRRLIQMGRELGIGTLVINQRPHYIDRTFITEADRLFYGHLNSEQDRIFVLDETGLRDKGVSELKIPKFHWWSIDQSNPDNDFFFKFKEKGMK